MSVATRSMLGRAGGSVPNIPGLGEALLKCNTLAEIRNLSPLPDEAQRLFDQEVINVGLNRLTIVGDLIANGQVFPIADPLSVMEVYWEAISKVGHAKRVMIPTARGENQLPDRIGHRIPVYATIDDFNLGVRTLRASQRVGAPLDTAMAGQATRRVNEAIEDAAINGAGFSVNGNDAPGLLTATNVNEYAYKDAEAWDASGHSGEDIKEDVLGMIAMLQADAFYGPYNLYIPTDYWFKLVTDFKSNGDASILARLQEIEAGGRRLEIKVADMLPEDRTVLMQMTSDVMDVIVGMQPTLFSWQSNDGWDFYFAVMAFVIPRIRNTYSDQSGIVVGGLTI